MSISLEKIDLLKERAHIGYQEAAELLDKFDGNVVEALIHLENSHKEQADQYQKLIADNKDKATKKRKSLFNQLTSSRLILQNNENKILDIPLSVGIIISIITLPFSIFVLVGLMLSGNKMVIKKSGEAFKMSQFIKIVNTDELTTNSSIDENDEVDAENRSSEEDVK